MLMATLPWSGQFAQQAKREAGFLHLLFVHDLPFGWALKQPKNEGLVTNLHDDLASVHGHMAAQQFAQQIGRGLVTNGTDEMRGQKRPCLLCAEWAAKIVKTPIG